MKSARRAAGRPRLAGALVLMLGHALATPALSVESQARDMRPPPARLGLPDVALGAAGAEAADLAAAPRLKLPDFSLQAPGEEALEVASPAFRPGWVPALWALLPGALLHGAGHAAAGDWRTGYRLLAVEGAGLAAMAAGIVPLVVSGASRRIVGQAATLTILGAGLVFTSHAADVYGAAGGARRGARAETEPPPVEAQLGYAYVHDPQFRFGSFAVTRLDWRWRFARLAPDFWIALDDDNQRYRGELALRVVGPRPDRRARDGTFIDLGSAVTYHRFGSDDFKVLTWELSAAARYDLARLSATLGGSFVELELGLGIELYDYTATTRGLGEDTAELLLARFGYGIYLGRPGRRRGELLLYYDHRHDDFGGGAGIGFKGDGPGGHGGVEGCYFFAERWGVAADLQVGSAYVGRLSVVVRGGGDA